MTQPEVLSLALVIPTAIAVAWAIYAIVQARRRRRELHWRTDMQRGGAAIRSYRRMMLIGRHDEKPATNRRSSGD